MTAIRHAIQQELFQPNEEKLLAMCHVEKYLKKKKSSFLCVVITTKQPFNVSVVQVKQSDKNFKKKRSWALAELKVVDGKSENPDTEEFDLQLDKTYRWVAANVKERQLLITTLWRQCSKYVLKDKPVFKNIPKAWVTEDIMTPESSYVTSPMFGLESDLTEDFQAITDKEQEDLSR